MAENRKRILFLTGTRADFGKLKPLMRAVEQHPDMECRIFVTGMHLLERFGYTYRQVEREVAPIVTEAVAAVLTPGRLDALRAAATAAAEAELNPAPVDESTQAEEAPTLYYGSVDEFVREFVCPIFRRNVGEEGRADYRWSARWWESAEAIARLEAMWRAWEHLRMDASTGTSVWLRDHADHHLGVLMSPTGPWALSKDTAGPDQPLPYEAPPEGLFPDVRDS